MTDLLGSLDAARVLMAILIAVLLGLGLVILWCARQLERTVERRRRRRLLQKIQAVARRRLP